MNRPRKDEILERLVLSDGVVEAVARQEQERSEPAGDHWSGPVLQERAAYLRKLAHFSQGEARDMIREFAGYSMFLMVLLRSGDAMAAEKHGHIFLILDGGASLVTGGTIQRAETVAEGETRGTAISEGLKREVRRGDVVHVEAGIPHQFLLSGEKSLSCLVIRMNADQ